MRSTAGNIFLLTLVFNIALVGCQPREEVATVDCAALDGVRDPAKRTEVETRCIEADKNFRSGEFKKSPHRVW